jgi:hypothetical protein
MPSANRNHAVGFAESPPAHEVQRVGEGRIVEEWWQIYSGRPWIDYYIDWSGGGGE